LNPSSRSDSVTPEEAWALLRKLLRPGGVETISLSRVVGRVLAREISSSGDMPPHDSALLDGFACRAEDLAEGGAMRLLGTVAPGESWEEGLVSRSAVGVMTGAPLPPGANVVLPAEEAEPAGDGAIRARRPMAPGSHIGFRGHLVAAGQCLLGRGERVGPEELAILAACGVARVKVYRRPRVRIVPTGSELVPAGETAEPYRVFASHGWYLRSEVKRQGGQAALDGPVPDDAELIRRAIGQSRGEDLVITTGGTGQGERDLVTQAMTGMGARAVFQGVRMRPGRTISLYQRGERLFLTLPGGMGGVRVGYGILVAPALRVLGGEVVGPPPFVECVTQEELRRDPEFHRFLEARVRAGGGAMSVAPLPRRPTGRGFSLPHGNGWIQVDPGTEPIPGGSLVRVLLGGGGIGSIAGGPQGREPGDP